MPKALVDLQHCKKKRKKEKKKRNLKTIVLFAVLEPI
jgi:hypothetical protein